MQNRFVKLSLVPGTALLVVLLVFLGAPRPAAADACCLAGLCFDLTGMLCTAAGGTGMPGVACQPFPCGGAGPYGACCVAAADICGYGGQFGCLAVMGTYQGNGTTCTPSPCPTAPMGACCTTANGCLPLTLNQCDIVGGVYQGDATVCTPDPCTPVCDVANINPVVGVRAAKKTVVHVSLSWTADAAASGYNIWFVTDKRQIPAHLTSVPPATLVPGCGNVGITTCDHMNAATGAAGTIHYYNVIGLCNGSEAPR